MSSILADYGFTTIKLYDDWKNADFIAQHKDRKTFLKVQLKNRLLIDKKYEGKDIYICFQLRNNLYLYPHDKAVEYILANSNVGNTKSWNKKDGQYHWPKIPKRFFAFLDEYKLSK